MQDVLPEELNIALAADGKSTNIDTITSQTSPHAKLVATGEDNHYLILPHEGPSIHISTSSPQQLQTADRCNGSTYNHMLKRMDEEPTRSTRGFWRREACIVTDRDGAVAKTVSHSIASGTAESTNEITCRQHRIHDVATEASGTYLHDHIAAVNHAFKALEDAHNRREFRTLMRSRYDKGLKIKRGSPPPHVTRHRVSVLNTYMPLEFDNDVFLKDRLTLERFANGDWIRDDDTYDLYVSGDMDELALRRDAVIHVPDVLAKEFSYMMLSRWKEVFVKLSRIGVGMNLNKLFQHTFVDWVVLHNEIPISRDIPRLLMVADGRAKDGDDDDAGEPPVDDAVPIDPEKAKKLAMSNHHKVGVGMVMHP